MSSRTGQRKKKETQSRRVIDKFSLKSWYTIHAPEIFDGEEIAETPAAESNYVLGRTITTSMMDLTGDYKKMHVKLTFKVDNIKGDHAYTQFYGHEYTRDFLRSLVRRRRTRIDGIINVITLDGAKVRLSVIGLTPFRCKASHERGIRKAMFDVLSKRSAKMPYEKLIKDVVSGKLATEIYKRAKKVHPIQNIEIWKSRVVNLPTMKLEEIKPASSEESPEAEEKAEVKEETTTTT